MEYHETHDTNDLVSYALKSSPIAMNEGDYLSHFGLVFAWAPYEY